MSIETQKTYDWRVVKLSQANTDTKMRLADQLVAQYGSSRRSDIRAKIGNNGQPFEQLLDNNIASL